MNNTREKLIDIVEDYADFLDWDTKEAMVDSIMEKFFATDNNVGDNWIPVTERKPDLELVEAQANDEELYKCLVTMKHRPSRGGKCVREMWYDGEGFTDIDYIDWTDLITHWMPLPQPPKGE